MASSPRARTPQDRPRRCPTEGLPPNPPRPPSRAISQDAPGAAGGCVGTGMSEFEHDVSKTNPIGIAPPLVARCLTSSSLEVDDQGCVVGWNPRVGRWLAGLAVPFRSHRPCD